MNGSDPSPVAWGGTPLHPALRSFLQGRPVDLPLRLPGEPAAGNGAAYADEDDKRLKTPHYARSCQPDGASMQVLLVSPPSPFVATVEEVLHQIDPRCRIVRAVREPKAALAQAKTASLVLVDLDDDTEGARALVRTLSAGRGGTPIVALSSSLERGVIDRALAAGALGYLPKTYSRLLVEGVLRLVLGGEGFRPQTSGQSARRGRPPGRAGDRTPEQDDASGLTPREKEVLAEVALGSTNLDIGNRLGMREATVKTHLHTIFGKLNVKNRAEAALRGARMSEIQQQQIEEAEQGRLNLSWLQPEMSHRRMRPGQWIFRLGDVGSELFYVQRGRVRLPELDLTIGPGEVFGEIGIFTPDHKRTCSALCETEADLLSLSSGQVRRIYFTNPHFAFFILALVATRLMADRRRARSQAG